MPHRLPMVSLRNLLRGLSRAITSVVGSSTFKETITETKALNVAKDGQQYEHFSVGNAPPNSIRRRNVRQRDHNLYQVLQLSQESAERLELQALVEGVGFC